eukprot:g15618.t1
MLSKESLGSQVARLESWCDRAPRWLRALALLYLSKRVLHSSLAVLWGAWRLLGRRPHSLAERYKAGSWAVITGACGGIGRAFCERVAKEGLNLVLLDLDRAQLHIQATQLRQAYGVDVEYIECDLCELGVDAARYQELVDKVTTNGKRDVSLLLNVAGYACAGYLDNIPLDSALRCMAVNTLPVVALTRLLLPHLKNRGRAPNGSRLRGGVLNVASVFGTVPIPSCSVYSGTKALVDYFTRAVAWECEYNDAPVDVLSLRPLGVSTPMIDSPPVDGIRFVHPDQCARGALADLGYENWTWGARGHQILGAFLHSCLTVGLIQKQFNNEVQEGLAKRGVDGRPNRAYRYGTLT